MQHSSSYSSRDDDGDEKNVIINNDSKKETRSKIEDDATTTSSSCTTKKYKNYDYQQHAGDNEDGDAGVAHQQVDRVVVLEKDQQHHDKEGSMILTPRTPEEEEGREGGRRRGQEPRRKQDQQQKERTREQVQEVLVTEKRKQQQQGETPSTTRSTTSSLKKNPQQSEEECAQDDDDRATSTNISEAAPPPAISSSTGMLEDVQDKEHASRGEEEPRYEQDGDHRCFLEERSQRRDDDDENAKSWHKELLFGLFLRSDPDRLSTISTEIGISFSRRRFFRTALTEDHNTTTTRNKRKMSATTTTSTTTTSSRGHGGERGRVTQRRTNLEGGGTTSPTVSSIFHSELCIVPYALVDQLKRQRGNEPEDSLTVAGSPCRFVPQKKVQDDFGSASGRIRSSPSTIIPVGGGVEEHMRTRSEVAYYSRTLEELEGVVHSKFRESETGTKVLSGGEHNINRNNASEQTESSATFSPLTLVYNEYSLACVSTWVARQGESANEELASDRRVRKKLKRRTMDSAGFQSPVSSPIFRLCSVCKNWGHYEVECQNLFLNFAPLTNISKKLNVQRTLRAFAEKKNEESSHRGSWKDRIHSTSESKNDGRNESPDDHDHELYAAKSTACEMCGSGFDSENLLLCDGCDCLFHAQCLDPPLDRIPEGDWFCTKCEGYNSDVSSVIEIEGCDGFVIEQSKISSGDEVGANKKHLQDSLRMGFHHDGWATAVGIVSRERVPVPAKLGADPVHVDPEERRRITQEIQLSVGELCWAKRCNAAAGQPGRDSWWPAIVMTVTQARRGNKRRPELTPYVVKFYAAIGANRVRATAVLPFFQHYEQLAYNQLTGSGAKNTGDLSLFRRAVEEANSEMGCKSLLMTLIKAREICGTSVVAGDEESAWNDAEEIEQDGFIIRARSNSAVTSSIVRSNAMPGNHSTSKISHVLLSAGSEEKPSLQTAKPPDSILGSVVAFETSTDNNLKRCSSISHPANVQYGVIIAICATSKKALVRPLPQMEKVVASGRTVTETRNMWRPPIRSCAVAASLWIGTNALHIVSEPPKPTTQSKFLRDVDSRLNEERERFRFLEMITQQKERRIGTMPLSNETNLPACSENISSSKVEGEEADLDAEKRNETAAVRSVLGAESSDRKCDVRLCEDNNDTVRCARDDDEKSIMPALDSEQRQEKKIAADTTTDALGAVLSPTLDKETDDLVVASDEPEGQTEMRPVEKTPSISDLEAASVSPSATLREVLSEQVNEEDLVPRDVASGKEKGASFVQLEIESDPNVSSDPPSKDSLIDMKDDTTETRAVELSTTDQCDPCLASTAATSQGPLHHEDTSFVQLEIASDPNVSSDPPSKDSLIDMKDHTTETRAVELNTTDQCDPCLASTAATSQDPLHHENTKADLDANLEQKPHGREGKEETSSGLDPDASVQAEQNENEKADAVQRDDEKSKVAEGAHLSEYREHDDSLARSTDNSSPPGSDLGVASNTKPLEEEPSLPPSQTALNDDVGDILITPAERAKRRRRGTEKEKVTETVEESKKKRRRVSPRKKNVMEDKDSSSSSRQDLSHSEKEPSAEVSLVSSPGKKQNTVVFEKDVFQAESILDERKTRSGGVTTIEYLIKWDGFSMDECTWEPARNILNNNFVWMYEIGKIEKILKKSKEAKKAGSTTAEVLSAVTRGKRKLAKGKALSRNRLCPFCGDRFRDEKSHLSHMNKLHKRETNFVPIRDAAKLMREDWFKGNTTLGKTKES